MRDTSAMDRPLDRRRSRLRPSVLAALGIVLVGGVFLVRPLVGRWLAADRSVDRARLRFATASRGDLVHDISVQGRVVAASRPTLYSPAAGIVALHAHEGQAVARGALLARIESPDLEGELQQERATLEALRSEASRLELAARRQNLENRQQVELLGVRLEAAEREAVRAERLAAEGLLNEIERERARDAVRIAGLERDQASLSQGLEEEMLRFQLADARHRVERQRLLVEEVERRVGELAIRAPFDGLVAAVPVEDRDAVARNQAIVGIVDLRQLEVAVAIPEAFADDVTPGLAAVVMLDRVEHPGVLTRVAPEVQASQVEGRVAFAAGTPPGLRQNQRVATRLVVDERRDVVKVPRGPFLEGSGGRSVWVVTDGLARRRRIEVGAVSVGEVEVVSGLEAGEEIVLSDLPVAEGAETVLLRD